jgi:hypothetical protein
MAVLITIVQGASQRLGTNGIVARIIAANNCDQPCWHGIRPGTTTIDNAYALLKADTSLIDNLNLGQPGRSIPPEQILCWSIMVTPRWRGCAGQNSTFTGPINLIELSPPANVFSLGQAIALFNDPVAVEMCQHYARVFFAHDIEVVVAGESFPALDPQQNVLLVRFLYPSDEPPYRFDTPAWRGFITWRGAIDC